MPGTAEMSVPLAWQTRYMEERSHPPPAPKS
jgi:hypothetical protein